MEPVPPSTSETLALRQSEDVVAVRRLVRTRMVELKFSLVDQTKMATAASELSRNALNYGGGGTVTFDVLRNGGRVGLRLVFHDEGPGIPDGEQALVDGYTTGGGLGLGLGGARRLVNEFEVVSAPGEGTTVTITRWR
jgi:serine/threonine-protein kinase RsbT